MNTSNIQHRMSNIEHRTVQLCKFDVGRWTFLFLLSAVLGLPSSVRAQAPQMINYQGRLLNGTNLVNGTVGLTLRLYAAPSGGIPLYADSNQVSVADSLYSTTLGDGTITGALASALLNTQVWMEAEVNGMVLAPRERVTSAPYALAVAGLLDQPSSGLVTDHRNLTVRRTNGTPQLLVMAGASTQDAQVLFGLDGPIVHGGLSWDASVGELRLHSTAFPDSYGVNLYGTSTSTRIGIGLSPTTNHKVRIRHNAGRNNATLSLEENNNGDAPRLSFESFVVPNRWTLQGWGQTADPQFHIIYEKSTTETNLVTVDGDDERVGIRTTAPAATLDVNGSLRVGGGSVVNALQAGTAVLGSGTNVAVYAVAFSNAFATPPRVVVALRNDPAFNVSDTFAATVRSVTPTNFVLNVVRVDSPAGWAQQLRVDWMAWE